MLVYGFDIRVKVYGLLVSLGFLLIEKPVVRDTIFLSLLYGAWISSTGKFWLCFWFVSRLVVKVFVNFEVLSNLCVLSVFSNGLAKEDKLITGRVGKGFDEVNSSKDCWFEEGEGLRKRLSSVDDL